ncbi:MAG: RDD family protein [Campylobacteraceae bacterium]|jgi:uncharacterized RDD family membrane protein YckC|nr:RDD family protein [Campylobacteraceae bacterium]
MIAAPISKRIKAFIVDMFMINMAVLYFMTYIVLGGKEEFRQNQFAIFVCTMIFGFILSVFFALKGQSPGYKAYNIELIDLQTGKKPHFFRAYFRFLSFVFSGAVIIGLALAFFREDKKCLHDILSDTICTECK